jgi:predicted transcriptional regulator
MVYLPPETKADLERLANYERRSLSQMAVYAIEEAIRRAKAEGKISSTPDASS